MKKQNYSKKQKIASSIVLVALAFILIISPIPKEVFSQSEEAGFIDNATEAALDFGANAELVIGDIATGDVGIVEGSLEILGGTDLVGDLGGILGGDGLDLIGDLSGIAGDIAGAASGNVGSIFSLLGKIIPAEFKDTLISALKDLLPEGLIDDALSILGGNIPETPSITGGSFSLGTPFGGKVLKVIKCSCTKGKPYVIIVGPPKGGPYLFIKGKTKVFLYGQQKRVDVNVLGTYGPPGKCKKRVNHPPWCVPVPHKGTIEIIGSSL